MNERYGKAALLLWVVTLFCGATVAFSTVYIEDGTPTFPGLAFSSAHSTGMSRVNGGVALGSSANPAILLGEPASAVSVKVRGTINFCDDITTACVGDGSDDVLSVSYAAVSGAFISVFKPSAPLMVGPLSVVATPILLSYDSGSFLNLTTGGVAGWTDTVGITLDTPSVYVTGLISTPAGQVAATKNIQYFISTGLWTTQAGCKTITIYSIGGGGGGGTGRKGVTTTARGGGGGGAGGSIAIETVMCSVIGAENHVVVGAGGAGASYNITDNSDGAAGTSGNPSYFGVSGGATYAVARGGQGGFGGTVTAGVGGTVAFTEVPGQAGGAGSTAAGVHYFQSAAGGGGGGLLDTSNVFGPGGAGGVPHSMLGATAAAGGATSAAIGVGGASVAANRFAGGAGGGGGAGMGGTGSGGGNYGGGGGGGGAGQNAGPHGGPGGAGATGFVVVIAEF